jgi:hypothetical protein
LFSGRSDLVLTKNAGDARELDSAPDFRKVLPIGP